MHPGATQKYVWTSGEINPFYGWCIKKWWSCVFVIVSGISAAFIKWENMNYNMLDNVSISPGGHQWVYQWRNHISCWFSNVLIPPFVRLPKRNYTWTQQRCVYTLLPNTAISIVSLAHRLYLKEGCCHRYVALLDVLAVRIFGLFSGVTIFGQEAGSLSYCMLACLVNKVHQWTAWMQH